MLYVVGSTTHNANHKFEYVMGTLHFIHIIDLLILLDSRKYSDCASRITHYTIAMQCR